MGLMTPEERKKMLARYRRRVERSDAERGKISPEIYMVAQFGLYFGWEAVKSARNNEITGEEMFALIEGAKKARTADLIEQTEALRVAVASIFSKSPSNAFKKGMRPYIQRAEVDSGD